MTDKDLHSLNRKELLELLVRQEKENIRLKNALKAANEEAEARTISIQNAGSIAEASLQLTSIFEEAEKAAQIYLDNVKRSCSQQTVAYDRIVSQARAEADRIIADAEAEKLRIMREADAYWDNVSQKMESFYQAHLGLRDILSINTGAVNAGAVHDLRRDYREESYAPGQTNATASFRRTARQDEPADFDEEPVRNRARSAEQKRTDSHEQQTARFVNIGRSSVKGKASPDDFDLENDEYFQEAFSPSDRVRSRAW